jgi:hypothetical protein
MNMTLNWIEAGIVLASVTTLTGLAILYRRVSAKSGVSVPGQQNLSEIAELRDLVLALQSKVEELVAAEGNRVASETLLPQSASQSAININKRSEALRMYNRGGDTDAVRVALGLPRADAMLLRKVQTMLSTPIPGIAKLSGNSDNRPLRPVTYSN